jgi:TetR/AcrR family transcriptional repressor of nem operon
MRLTKAQAAENRQHIIDTAGHLFREHGVDGVGIADLMKAAGFTHGGFYNHFPSKEALVAEVALSGLQQKNVMLAQALRDEAGCDSTALAQFIGEYLSSAHRENRAGGCTLASLACDAARQGKQVQGSFAHGIEEKLDILTASFEKPHAERQGGRPSCARVRAIHLLSVLVGAVMLARAVADANPALSDEILQVNRRQLLGQRKQGRRAGRGRHS